MTDIPRQETKNDRREIINNDVIIVVPKKDTARSNALQMEEPEQTDRVD